MAEIEETAVNDADVERLLSMAIDRDDAGDRDQAISFYKICIEYGDVIAMSRLALLLTEPPEYANFAWAEHLYKRACVAGYWPACYNLANLYGKLGRSELSQRYLRLADARGFAEDGSDDEDD